MVRPYYIISDLRDFFSDLGSGGQKKEALKMTSFLLIQEQTVKLVRYTNSLY